MFDILTAIHYGELSDLRGKPPLEQPHSISENRILCRLRSLDPQTAKEFQRDIRTLAIEERDMAFQSGVRFGAQLMAQLLDEF